MSGNFHRRCLVLNSMLMYRKILGVDFLKILNLKRAMRMRKAERLWARQKRVNNMNYTTVRVSVVLVRTVRSRYCDAWRVTAELVTFELRSISFSPCWYKSVLPLLQVLICCSTVRILVWDISAWLKVSLLPGDGNLLKLARGTRHC